MGVTRRLPMTFQLEPESAAILLTLVEFGLAGEQQKTHLPAEKQARRVRALRAILSKIRALGVKADPSMMSDDKAVVGNLASALGHGVLTMDGQVIQARWTSSGPGR